MVCDEYGRSGHQTANGVGRGRRRRGRGCRVIRARGRFRIALTLTSGIIRTNPMMGFSELKAVARGSALANARFVPLLAVVA